MSPSSGTYLALNGVPVSKVVDPDLVYSVQDPLGAWYPTRDNYLYEIDEVCAQLHDAFDKVLFGSKKRYYQFFRDSPEFLSTAGLNSESTISKEQFSRLIETLPDKGQTNRALYLYDCRKLVTGIQECSKEVIQLQGEFYQVLNLEELHHSPIEEEDGVRFVTSPVVTKLFALLGFVFIRLHSLLDYATKLAIEIEHLKTDFVSYPRLACKNSLYSDRKQVSFNGKVDTLFECCTLLAEVEAIRNQLIHDGFLDDMPKAYKVISGGACIEKFLLFPDQCDQGRLDAFKNRNLFYAKEDKINLRLPTVVCSFQIRLLNTLRILLAGLDPMDQ